jgi:histidine triad (HIT) family protein
MSLTGAYDPDNVFARILRGEIPNVTVFEDDRVLAFMDVFPQSEGHVLVISKVSRARNLIDAEPEVINDLVLAAQRIAGAAPKALGCDGVSIMQFNGAAGGQTVFHLHVHVIPRWSDRPLKGHAENKMADPDALKATAARIAAAL